jgi:hypothetical protein
MTDQAIPHRLVALVQRVREVRITDAAKSLNMDEKSVLDMAKILSEPKILEIFYAVSGDVIIRQGEEFRRAVSDKASFDGFSFGSRKVEAPKRQEQHNVSDFLDQVRRRIDEKKTGTGTQ